MKKELVKIIRWLLVKDNMLRLAKVFLIIMIMFIIFYGMIWTKIV